MICLKCIHFDRIADSSCLGNLIQQNRDCGISHPENRRLVLLFTDIQSMFVRTAAEMRRVFGTGPRSFVRWFGCGGEGGAGPARVGPPITAFDLDLTIRATSKMAVIACATSRTFLPLSPNVSHRPRVEDQYADRSCQLLRRPMSGGPMFTWQIPFQNQTTSSFSPFLATIRNKNKRLFVNYLTRPIDLFGTRNLE